MGSANGDVRQAQARYKADFDKGRQAICGRHPRRIVRFLATRSPRRRKPPERNKLAFLATGPYRVVKTSTKNVVIINASGVDETVSRDRVSYTRRPRKGFRSSSMTVHRLSANVKSAHGLLR